MTQEEHLCLLLFAVTDIQMHQVKNGLRMLKKDVDEWGGEWFRWHEWWLLLVVRL